MTQKLAVYRKKNYMIPPKRSMMDKAFKKEIETEKALSEIKGKPDGYKYDLFVGKRVRTMAMSYKKGMHYVKKLNAKR